MEADFSLIPILLSFIVSILFSVYYLLFLLKSRNDGSQSLRTPPGSTGFPYIGETLEFLSTGRKGVPEKFVLDRMKKYSSMVIKTSLLGQPFALLCGPEANKFLFSNENKLVRSWWPRSTGMLLGASEDTNLAIATRNLLIPYFSLDSLQKYVPIMDTGTQQHLQIHWEGKDVVTVHALTKLYTSTIASRIFLGIEDQETAMRLHKPLDQLMRGVISMPLNIPGTNFYRTLKAKAQLLKDLDAWRQKWKSDFVEGKLTTSQSSLANILKETFKEDHISNKLLILFVGAYDTTSSTLACIIMLLGQHPYVYDKVLAEQRDIRKSKRQGETLNWGDIQKMKYSWNVACESLRLHSGTGGFREAISDFIYNGFAIPKGWKLHSSQYATHKNPEYFKDPEKFDPSRFEGDGPLPYTYVPFGGGPRMCPGREYARVKILVFMHHLVTKYRWKQIFPDEKIVTAPVSRPAKGLPIRLYPLKS